MSFTLHPGAEHDLGEVARFYRKEAGRGVAERFLDEFGRVAALVDANPGLGIPTGGDRRWFPLHGFLYSIIYRLVGTDGWVLVVRHQHRDPEQGGQRR